MGSCASVVQLCSGHGILRRDARELQWPCLCERKSQRNWMIPAVPVLVALRDAVAYSFLLLPCNLIVTLHLSHSLGSQISFRCFPLHNPIDCMFQSTFNYVCCFGNVSVFFLQAVSKKADSSYELGYCSWAARTDHWQSKFPERCCCLDFRLM